MNNNKDAIAMFSEVKEQYNIEVQNLTHLKRQIMKANSMDVQLKSKLRITIESLLIDLNEELFFISEELAKSYTFERAQNLIDKAQECIQRKQVLMQKINDSIHSNSLVQEINKNSTIPAVDVQQKGRVVSQTPDLTYNQQNSPNPSNLMMHQMLGENIINSSSKLEISDIKAQKTMLQQQQQDLQNNSLFANTSIYKDQQQNISTAQHQQDQAYHYYQSPQRTHIQFNQQKENFQQQNTSSFNNTAYNHTYNLNKQQNYSGKQPPLRSAKNSLGKQQQNVKRATTPLRRKEHQDYNQPQNRQSSQNNNHRSTSSKRSTHSQPHHIQQVHNQNRRNSYTAAISGNKPIVSRNAHSSKENQLGHANKQEKKLDLRNMEQFFHTKTSIQHDKNSFSKNMPVAHKKGSTSTKHKDQQQMFDYSNSFMPSETVQMFSNDVSRLRGQLVQMMHRFQENDDRYQALEKHVDRLTHENVKLNSDIKIVRNQHSEILHTLYSLEQKNNQLQQENQVLKQLIQGEKDNKSQETNLPLIVNNTTLQQSQTHDAALFTSTKHEQAQSNIKQQQHATRQRKVSPFAQAMQRQNSSQDINKTSSVGQQQESVKGVDSNQIQDFTMKNIATSIRTLNIHEQTSQQHHTLTQQDDDQVFSHNKPSLLQGNNLNNMVVYKQNSTEDHHQDNIVQNKQYNSIDLDQHSSVVDPGNVMANIGNQTTSMNQVQIQGVGSTHAAMHATGNTNISSARYRDPLTMPSQVPLQSMINNQSQQQTNTHLLPPQFPSSNHHQQHKSQQKENITKENQNNALLLNLISKSENNIGNGGNALQNHLENGSDHGGQQLSSWVLERINNKKY